MSDRDVSFPAALICHMLILVAGGAFFGAFMMLIGMTRESIEDKPATMEFIRTFALMSIAASALAIAVVKKTRG